MSALAPVLTTPDELLLAPEGVLDARAAVDFRRSAGPLVAARADRLVVNLRRVTHLDAAGLAAVSHAVIGQRRQGGDVHLLLPLRLEARRVLEMTGLDLLLEAGVMTGTRTPTRRRLAGSGVVLAVAMAVANAGNYGLNVVLARWLDPAAFGDLTLVVTLFLVLTAAAVAAQLFTAAQVARLDATGRWVESADLERWLARRAGWIGVAAAAVLVGTAPALADLFQMASWVPLAVFGLGLPFYLAQAVYRGAAQGRLRFGRLSASFLLEVAVRLVLSVALVAAGAGVTGAAAGLSLSFVACWFHLRPLRAATPTRAAIAPATRRAVFATAGPAMILLVGQIVVNNGDVLIVKSRFDAETAGTYAAVALVGRAVFFCTWAVVTTLFPAAARQDATGDPDPGLLRRAVGVTATASTVLTAAAWTVGPRVLELAFGAEYTGVGHLLGPYALATSLFALVNLLATHDLSLGRRRGPVVLAIGGAVQSVLVLLAGTTPDRVVWAQVLAMAGLLLAAAVLRRPALATASDPAPPASARLRTWS